MAYNTKIDYTTLSNIPSFATVATTGAYSDLTGKPNLSIIPTWIKITKTYSDFASAGVTNTINIYTLPAKSVVHATIVNPTATFTGGTINAYALSVGLVTVADLAAAVSLFTIPTRPFPSALTLAGKFGTTDTITATATSGVGLLNAATQGSVDIYLLISQLI